jgi:hypothetical protein
MPVYFCDSLKQVSILNGVARLEFQRLESQAANGANGELRAVAEFTVAIPVQGLAQTINLLEGVRDRLVREGVFKSAAPDPTPLAVPLPATDRSPNF